jgi:predicted RNase H-like HicB family nuclease
MNIKYEIRIRWSDEDNSYIAEIPELEGCIADGKTPGEALRMLEDVFQIWIDSAKKYNSVIPGQKKNKKKSEVA